MVLEKFKEILKRERVSELVPFLKALEKDGKKEIASQLKALSKEYLEYQQFSSLVGSSMKQKATPGQANMLYATAFVCLNRKEYQKFDQSIHMISNTLMDEILPWYCPDWFSDLINDFTKREWMPWTFKYNNAMALVDKGYLKPSDELIARLIPDMIFDRTDNHKFLYAPQNLETRAITLEKHIWLIFQFETTIHFSDRYLHFQNSNKEERHWLMALKDYVDKNKLDKKRLLQESILATGRNFNKALSGWFIELFDFMEPTQRELLELQPELLNSLSSQHSKAVNSALNAFKEIVNEKEFNINGFLEHTLILLSSETKSVVASTLILLEKILRKNPTLQEDICLSICQAFIHNDESIQNKVSKILLKYHDGSWISVTDEIRKYADSMLMSSKKSLAEFISSKDEPVEVLDHRSVFTQDIAVVPNAVQEVVSMDELIFLASQAFDNNDPLHIDLLPATLVNLQDQLKEDVLHKFEPALQRAYSTVTNDWTANMGYLDHLLATFFIDLTHLLIDRFPKEGNSLKELHESFKKKEAEKKAKWSWYSPRISALETWSTQSRDNTYLIHKTILFVAYQKIRDKDHLPILSTSTHEQGYLDPQVLVKRLALYQNKNVLPENLDFQLAISRLAPFNHDQALQEAKQSLAGEVLRIIEFLFIKDSKPIGPFTTPSLWFMAGITKAPDKTFPEFNGFAYASLPKSTFTGNVPWKSIVEHFKINQYNFQKKRNEEVPSQHNVLRLTLNSTPTIWRETEETKEGMLSKLAKLVLPVKKLIRSDVYILYEYLSLKAQFLSAEQNDIQRFIYLFPSNPNPLLALVTSKSLVHGTFSSEIDKKIITKTLEALVNLRFIFSEVTHLFIATCMITSDKTVRSFAAELWNNAVKSGNVQSAQLGRLIGIHLAVEYAPLKRFTDLVSSNLMQISKLHNHEMELLLNSILLELPDQPPVGTKRLLELHSELLAINNSSIKEEQIKSRLQIWSSSPNMKKVISSLV